MAGRNGQWSPKWVGYLIVIGVLSAGFLVASLKIAFRGEAPSETEIGAMLAFAGVIVALVKFGLRTNGKNLDNKGEN